MGLSNFDKVINVKLYRSGIDNATEEQREFLDAYIKCPAHGRKPNIEIQGNLYSADKMSPIQVNIKNLYLDGLSEKNYTRVVIEAGYADSLQFVFEGRIQMIYQAAPGPESEVVINCLEGNVYNWLNNNVELNLPVNFSIKDAVEQIASALKYSTELNGVETISPDKMTYSGSARGAITELKKRFPELDIIVNRSTIRCFSRDYINIDAAKAVSFLSSPPQLIGSEETKGLATLTAPWDPSIRPGDTVSFPSKYYSARKLSGRTNERTFMRVVTEQIQFSTTGNANKMVLMGMIA